MKNNASTKRRLYFTVTTSKRDQAYLDSAVATLKHTRQKTNKSELVALALTLLRQKSTKEVERLLRASDPAG